MDSELNFSRIVDSVSNYEHYADQDSLIIKGNSLEVLQAIPDKSISLILTDPPYHSTKKKNILGDTSFSTDNDFISWMGKYSEQWRRILKPNGSIFVFASSQMEAQLTVRFSRDFNILASIVWTKPNAPGFDGWKNKMKKENLRQWYGFSERIIFMEPKFEGNLFGSYFGIELKKWRKQLKLSGNKLTELVGEYGKVNHGGAVSNWEAGRNIPSRYQYAKIIDALKSLDYNHEIDFPDYEDVIRPFNVTGEDQFTDVWTFENVRPYKGKHPAEKPTELLVNAIKATTYEDDVVLDSFSGSGATGISAKTLHRKSVLIELDPVWYEYGKDRLGNWEPIEEIRLF
ncbi:DNA-methyltransferase [Leuconostoc citreum]|uniref:DNA-methyltransferase n=1 Tax=Leuconostoc citreum TaxID=33964 RepID=UPI002A81C9AB|nr:site-specific DNA-methyltransferase [Leuconostoc citreum]MDY5162772.1 site-specific DNA-methyltransferase [Leuconostoc citreum]MDY5166389.1 site-specific DNA-methyltransferase [Leuconostoc citreum]